MPGSLSRQYSVAGAAQVSKADWLASWAAVGWAGRAEPVKTTALERDPVKYSWPNAPVA